MSPRTTSLAAALGALASLAIATSARAEDPPPPERPSPGPAWLEALGATGVVPPACASLVGEALSPVPEPAPGRELPRLHGDEARLAFTRLEADGGIPYADFRGGLVRARSTFSDDLWVPRAERREQMNRGYARLEVAPGRVLLLVDHMTSPITSATSLWEDTGKHVVMRAAFPGEIASVEERPEALVFHLYDAITATRVVWDRAAAALVGECLVETQGIFAAEADGGLDAIYARPPTAATVARAGALYLAPAPDDPKAYKLGKVAARARVALLFTRPDGWSLVIAPLTERDVWTKLFLAKPSRAWRMAWVAPRTLAP